MHQIEVRRLWGASVDGSYGDEFLMQFRTADVLDGLRDVAAGSCALVLSSPPYNIRKVYERDERLTLEEYLAWQEKVVSAVCQKVALDGSVCWQVGSYIKDGEIFPLDIHFYAMFKKHGFKLRNRIIWQFNFGLNADRRFSGRYETLLWFTRSDNYKFNLDPVRIPQLYPGKRHSKTRGERAGKPTRRPKPTEAVAQVPKEWKRLKSRATGATANGESKKEKGAKKTQPRRKAAAARKAKAAKRRP